MTPNDFFRSDNAIGRELCSAILAVFQDQVRAALRHVIKFSAESESYDYDPIKLIDLVQQHEAHIVFMINSLRPTDKGQASGKQENQNSKSKDKSKFVKEGSAANQSNDPSGGQRQQSNASRSPPASTVRSPNDRQPRVSGENQRKVH